MEIINFILNGEPTTIAIRPNTTLLKLLRNHLGLTGTKCGCEMGDCGACTVLLDNEPVNSCLVLALDIEGREITTIEGIAKNGNLHPLQQAFIETGAIQCGYCTPGMVMSAYALLLKKPNPTIDEIKEAISGNLCRCTGYQKIVEAVQTANLIARSEATKQSQFVAQGKLHADFSVVGKGLPRKDAFAKVTGQGKYTADIRLPGMLYGKVLFSSVPHAKILSIETEKAKSLPGVKAVITAQDVPKIPYGVSPARYDEYIFAIDKVRYAGDRIAAVCAVDEETAEKALRLIEVKFEELPAVFDPIDAMKENAPQIHEKYPRNINTEIHWNFGDVERAFSEADYVREDTFVGNRTIQAQLEPHSALAYWDGSGILTVYSSTQTVYYVRHQLSRVLEMPESKIRVIRPYMGGGFGGKGEATVLEFAASIFSRMTGKPVLMTFSRKEMFLHGRGRHKQYITLKTGVKKDGTILGVHSKTVLDGGAYTGYGITTAYYSGAMLPTLYRIPNFRFDGFRVYTNLPPCGAQRGNGTPQPRFAFESQLDIIAEELNIDPIEIRLRNATGKNEKTVNEFLITSNEYKACLEKVREISDWDKKIKAQGTRHKAQVTGMGVAGSCFVSGAAYPIVRSEIPHSNALVQLSEDGATATLYIGTCDIGQGSDTVLSQIAAESLGIDYKDVRIVSGDSTMPIDLGSYSSRVTFMAGNAIIAACNQVKRSVLETAAKMLQEKPESLIAKNGKIFVAENPAKSLLFNEAAAQAFIEKGPIIGQGSYKPPKLGGTFKGAAVGTSPAYSFGAFVCEVKVDLETGKVTVLKFYGVHDSGTVINPITFEGQVEGSCVMGMGETLLEEVVFENGIIKNPNLRDYLLPTVKDAPEIISTNLGIPDPNGPFGAKEVGEGSILAIFGAIANAIYNATGVRIKELPITPEKILKGLGKI